MGRRGGDGAARDDHPDQVGGGEVQQRLEGACSQPNACPAAAARRVTAAAQRRRGRRRGGRGWRALRRPREGRSAGRRARRSRQTGRPVPRVAGVKRRQGPGCGTEVQPASAAPPRPECSIAGTAAAGRRTKRTKPSSGEPSGASMLRKLLSRRQTAVAGRTASEATRPVKR